MRRRLLHSRYDLDVTMSIFKVGEKDVFDVFTMKSWFVLYDVEF